MNKRYYTVVYEITNEDSFAKHVAPAVASLSVTEDDGNQLADGLRVVACGKGDTMTAYDALHELALEIGHDPDQIIREFCEVNDIDADATIG